MNRKIVCHKCKTFLSPGSSYCTQCGSKITEADYVSEDSVLSNPVYLKQGTVLSNKYRINDVIGQGGFGITYDGTDIKLDMHVAVKEYFPNTIASRHTSISNDVTCSGRSTNLYKQGMDSFLMEAKNMARFAGEENFVAVHDCFTENNTAYIVMEFVDGLNLKQYMQQRGRFTLDEAMPIIIPVMNTLEKIHEKGMIHRDVSPSNIMIRPDGKIRLLDFGSVQDIVLETQKMTAMSAVYKMGYSPIEQLTKDMKQGPYTDIYALCATIYHMLTGSKPPSPLDRLSGKAELAPLSSKGVEIIPYKEEALLRGLAIYPEARIQTIAELREVLCSSGGEEEPASEGENKGHILKAALLGTAFLIAAAVIGWILFHRNADSGNNDQPPSSTDSAEEIAAGDTSKPEDQPPQPEDKSSQPAEEPSQEEKESSQAAEAPSQEEKESSQPAEAPSQEEKEPSKPAEEPSQNEKESSQPEDNSPQPKEEIAAPEKHSDIPGSAYSYEGHHYFIYDDVSTSWEDAMERCKKRGGYLAVINDPDENEELYYYMVEMGYDIAYFGLSDPDHDGNWRYIYGDSSDFRDWGVNSKGVEEPNNADNNEIHAELDIHMYNGHWNDAKFGKQVFTPEGKKYKNRYTYICEWDE